MKRAGLDYWHNVDLAVHDSVDAFVREQLPRFQHAVFFSKHSKYGSTCLFDYKFPALHPKSSGAGTDPGSLALLFGNEVQGIDFLPDDVIAAHPRLFLPMGDGIRSYNLSNVVSVGVFEAIRQLPELFAAPVSQTAPTS